MTIKINGDAYRKQWNLCKELLPYTDFYKSRNMKDGMCSRCIDCHKKMRKPTVLDKIRENEHTQGAFR